jgi:hypothetical protein
MSGKTPRDPPSLWVAGANPQSKFREPWSSRTPSTDVQTKNLKVIINYHVKAPKTSLSQYQLKIESKQSSFLLLRPLLAFLPFGDALTSREKILEIFFSWAFIINKSNNLSIKLIASCPKIALLKLHLSEIRTIEDI